MERLLINYAGDTKKDKQDDEDKWVELWLKSKGATNYKRLGSRSFSYTNAEG
jgi:hypothetical protein